MDEDDFSFELLSKKLVQSPIIFDETWNCIASIILNKVKANKLSTEQNGRNQILICGAKSVGKSTFAKYLSNCILSSSEFEKIAFLDCNEGQPELSPPGLLLLSTLSKPLICPHMYTWYVVIRLTPILMSNMLQLKIINLQSFMVQLRLRWIWYHM